MRDIPGYEGIYAATSCGKIWSYRRKKFLKPEVLENGYLRVCLSVGSIRNRYRVHRLIAMTYLDMPEGKCEINHLDGNKQNNCVNNLEWCSHRENIRHYMNTICKNFLDET